jgi:hypothetical protein
MPNAIPKVVGPFSGGELEFEPGIFPDGFVGAQNVFEGLRNSLSNAA